jgi:hypothetical protein
MSGLWPSAGFGASALALGAGLLAALGGLLAAVGLCCGVRPWPRGLGVPPLVAWGLDWLEARLRGLGLALAAAGLGSWGALVHSCFFLFYFCFANSKPLVQLLEH